MATSRERSSPASLPSLMTEAVSPAVSPTPPLPAYGRSSLADLVPSLLAALGVAGFPNPLSIDPLQGVCLLLIDGLGSEPLNLRADVAPFLHAAASRNPPLTACFPATTATSIASIGTGLPPGDHGLVGYAFAVPGHDRAMNALKWELYGSGPEHDLRKELPPERFQPRPTAFERAAADGVRVSLVGPPHLARSALERAVLRGGRYSGALSLGDLAFSAARLCVEPLHDRRFVYAYHPGLDTTGHVRGVASDAWALELSNVDRLAASIADRLTAGTALVVTGDHGMVDLEPEERLELEDEPGLASGVRLLAGEAPARHVHTVPGAESDVLDAWRSLVGDRMWVVSREQAVVEGWFGASVSDSVRPRIGDVVAAAFGRIGIFQRSVDAMQPSFVGNHGSLTRDEQLVPFAVMRP